MNLPEFLLARIAEDERVAALSVSHGTGGFPSAYWQRLYNGPGQHPVMAAARLRAECDAKRRIVELAEQAEATRRRVEAVGGEYPTGRTVSFALRYLALPYADHDDYREEWRP